MSSMGLAEKDRCVNPRPVSAATQEKPKDTAPVVYTYTDANGKYLFEKRRVVKPDGTKTFFQTTNDPKVKGVSHLGNQAKTLYNLPAVLKGVADGQMVYINEGEKACQMFSKLGLISTCQPAGAGPGKWLPQHTAIFKGAYVTIVADRDQTGEDYAREVCIELRSVCRSVRIVQSATINAKDDAYDHFKSGFRPEQFVERPDLMPKRGLTVNAIETYQIENPQFLIGTHIRLAQMNLLDAEGAAGKTTVALAIAAAGSNGWDPVYKKKITPFKTLYFGDEDSGGDIRFIYESLGGKPGFLMDYRDAFPLSGNAFQLLKETIEEYDIKFVVFDALAYYLPVKDLNNAVELVKPLQALRAVAMETGAAILNLRHIGKGKDGKPISEMGIGSVQIRNSHRSQLVMLRHPDKEKKSVRVITHEKGSIRVEMGEPFGWAYEDGRFTWVDIDPAELDSSIQTKGGKVGDCEKWLRANLTGRFAQVSEFTSILRDLGFTESTIKRARANVDVKCVKDGQGRWLATIEKLDPFAD